MAFAGVPGIIPVVYNFPHHLLNPPLPPPHRLAHFCDTCMRLGSPFILPVDTSFFRMSVVFRDPRDVVISSHRYRFETIGQSVEPNLEDYIRHYFEVGFQATPFLFSNTLIHNVFSWFVRGYIYIPSALLYSTTGTNI